MHFFTSITTSYLPKARVLAETLKKTNPDAIMHLVVSDNLPAEFDLKQENFDYVWYAEDFIKTENNNKWFFLHTVVELCTAVKGAAALHILKETNADKLIYLDPDIGVFDDLTPLSKMLDKNSVLLTPHQTEPAVSHQGIIDEEICSLKHGVYNFGFFAIKNDKNGLKFLNWWNDRLLKFCYDDIPNGLFTDQKWADLAPALFDFIKIIHDPEYNVATWNLATRKITGNKDSGWFVNGKPLRFYHFTGFDSGAHRAVLAQHAKPGDSVWDLSLMYEEMMYNNGQEKYGKTPFKYAFYNNGEKIEKRDRIAFRIRSDIYNYFDNPFEENCYKWMRKNNKTDNKDILKICKLYKKYKLLRKLSIGKAHKKYKQQHIYYEHILNDIKNKL
jgi:hypothetical protein